MGGGGEDFALDGLRVWFWEKSDIKFAALPSALAKTPSLCGFARRGRWCLL